MKKRASGFSKPTRQHRTFLSRITRKSVMFALFPVVGLLSLVWFLLRVIPKPSRADYPCQRVAAPIAASFVTWLVALGSSVFAFRLAEVRFREVRYPVAVICCIVAIVAGGFAFFGIPKWQARAELFVPTDPPNTPMGVAKGANPGRVVWVHEPDATSWDGTTGSWMTNDNTDPAVVEEMLSRSIQYLAGTTDQAAAWDRLFHNFNQSHQKDAPSYQPGEKIAVKLNANFCKNPDHSLGDPNDNIPAPQLVLALLRQLVNTVGVDDADICFYDSTRFIPDAIVTPCRAEFPDVRFMEMAGGDPAGGREERVRNTGSTVEWSWGDGFISTEIVEKGAAGYEPSYLPTVLTEADYLINFAVMKGHGTAGVTLCAKNHFGTFIAEPDPASGYDPNSSPRGAGVHPYVAVHDTGIWSAQPMGVYNSLVDLMGHEEAGGKTLLCLIDGLYTSKKQGRKVDATCRWLSEPFDNDWTSSIFVSQDQVAIDSVCVDFMRNEPTMDSNAGGTVYGSVDNYLHESSLADDPPSGAFYDPENDGTRLASLGVHEHWDSAAGKSYSRNMGTGDGIELVRAEEPLVLSITPSTTGPTAADSVDFTVVFHEPVSDFDDEGDVSVTHTGTADTGVSFTQDSSTNYTVTVGGITGNGSFTLSVNRNCAVDSENNGNLTGGPSAAVLINNNTSVESWIYY